MGEYNFQIPSDWTFDLYHANSAHIVGIDGVPWPCRLTISDPDPNTQQRILTVNRNQDGSGRLYLLYDFETLGEHLICTGTLLPSAEDEPHDLLLEVARGTLNRMRNQMSIWGEGGLAIEDTTLQKVADATTQLALSLIHISEPTRPY